MMYRLIETEKLDPSYKHTEWFTERKTAQKRMSEFYNDYRENPSVEKAEIDENSAIVYINDGNEIEWEIESIEEIIENAFEYDEVMTEYEMQERLETALGKNITVKQKDSWIDDGCGEDEEDEYVMGVLFTVTDKGGNYADVRIFYGDITGKIGWVKVDCD